MSASETVWACSPPVTKGYVVTKPPLLSPYSTDIAPGAKPVQFLSPTFTPAGMAVDPVNERLYVSNFSGNSIQAYSTTTAKLIETIQ